MNINVFRLRKHEGTLKIDQLFDAVRTDNMRDVECQTDASFDMRLRLDSLMHDETFLNGVKELLKKTQIPSANEEETKNNKIGDRLVCLPGEDPSTKLAGGLIGAEETSQVDSNSKPTPIEGNTNITQSLEHTSTENSESVKVNSTPDDPNVKIAEVKAAGLETSQ
jgi:hypothetical protein